jgi:D-arabinose 1-dehydrogenase-like Zn-dependent alcohol dehydrogenase
MKAVRLVQVGKPLEQADVALPEIGPADVLVRVAACGICHSDAHYRAGVSLIDSLPVTLGHEVAGHVESVGEEVTHVSPGDRVYVHYLVSCGCCGFCSGGNEQFCAKAQMIGKHRDGGYAEYIKASGRNVFVLPNEISFEQGAVMMCSSATALHALNKAHLKRGVSLFLDSADWDFQPCSCRELSAAKRSMSSRSTLPNSPQSQRLEAWQSMRLQEIPFSKSSKQPAEKA